MKILFVCSGNTCRSPMAELYFNDRCRRAGLSSVAAGSAGTWAGDGQRISAPAADVMQDLGIDPTSFRSRAFRRSLALEYGLIFGMTQSHCNDLLAIAPEAEGKVRRLLELTGGGDVSDPFGGTAARYRQTFEMMKPALDALAERFMTQPKQPNPGEKER